MKQGREGEEEKEMNPRYGWVMVALGAFMTCIAIGAMFSLAVFLQPITASTGWSHTAVSAAMTIGFLAMGAAGFGWGALSDRIGPRFVVLAGAVLLGLGLFLASRAQSPLQFQLAFGLLVGIAIGSFFSPMIAAVMGWMTAHRGLAVALVSVGVGVAPVTMSPFAAWLITQMDWRAAQGVLAVLVWVTLVPAALFARRPPATQAAEQAAEGPPMKLRDAFVSAPFIVLALTFFACCAAHAGPIFHTVTYAMTCGIAPLAAVTVYSVEGLAGLGGRLALGVLADRLGVKRVLIAGLLIQAVAAGHVRLRVAARRVLRRRRHVRLRLRRRDAALRGAGARVLRPAHPRRGVRRRRHGVEPRHGARTGPRRLDLRHVRPLYVDVPRLGRDRPRRRRDRARFSPVSPAVILPT